MCLNTFVEVGYFILATNKLMTHRGPEKTRIDPKMYKLNCDLKAFPERYLRFKDTINRMLAENILQAPEAQLLSLDALVPWYKY